MYKLLDPGCFDSGIKTVHYHCVPTLHILHYVNTITEVFRRVVSDNNIRITTDNRRGFWD